MDTKQHVWMLSLSCLGFYAVLFVTSLLAPILLNQLGYGSWGFIVLAFHMIAFAVSFFFAKKMVPQYGARKMLPVGSALTIIYVATYIIPVSCAEQNSVKGLCSKGFSGALIFLTALLSGYGLGIFHISQEEYLKQCKAEKGKLFGAVVTFFALFGCLLGMIMLSTEKLRIAFYVILTLLAIDAFLVQLFLPTTLEESTAKPEETEQKSVFKETLVEIADGVKAIYKKETILLTAIYHGMQIAYCLSILSYLAGESYIKENKDNTSTESNQKVTTAFLGYATAYKALHILTSMHGQNLNKNTLHHITFTLCGIALIFAIIVTHVEREIYGAGWFFAAVFWGLQDQFFTFRKKIILEENEGNLETGYLAVQSAASVIIYFLAAILDNSVPIILQILLIVVWALSYLVTFLKKMKAKTGLDEGLIKVEAKPEEDKKEEEKKAEEMLPAVEAESQIVTDIGPPAVEP